VWIRTPDLPERGQDLVESDPALTQVEVAASPEAADALMTASRSDLDGGNLAGLFADGEVPLVVRLIRMAGDQCWAGSPPVVLPGCGPHGCGDSGWRIDDDHPADCAGTGSPRPGTGSTPPRGGSGCGTQPIRLSPPLVSGSPPVC
jgi:hypothetical protein